MISWLGKIFKTKNTHSKNKTQRRSTRLNLEALEDRTVLDALQWSPVDGLNWSTAKNWFNFTTQAVAIAPPTSSDDVTFDGIDTWNSDCKVTSPAICRSITSTNRYTKGLDISGGSLSIYDPLYGASSNWQGGYITSLDSPGTVNVYENMTYNSSFLNSPGGQKLTINVGGKNTPYLYLGPNCTSVNAAFNVGYNPTDNVNPGTLSLQETQKTTFLANPINVSSQGNLGQVNGGWVYNVGDVNSAGNVTLTGSTFALGSDHSMNITGGSLATTGSGNSYLYGDVNVSNASVQLSVGSDIYSYLYIQGTLTFGSGSSYVYHVNGKGTLSSNYLQATNVNLFIGATSQCYTDGTALSMGGHSYTTLEATTNFAGKFTDYQWLGLGTKWGKSYAGEKFTLSNPGAVYLWTPKNVALDDDWNNAENWTDLTTNQVATTEPGPNTDVRFTDVSPTLCDLTLAGECRTITTDSGWTGTITLHDTKLIVHGDKDYYSVISGGSLNAIGSSRLVEDGGHIDYNSSTLNNAVPNPGKLVVVVKNGGDFTVDEKCNTINAIFKVGLKNKGVLNFDTPSGYSTLDNSVIRVGQFGELNFRDNTSLSGFGIIDDGVVNLGAKATLTINPSKTLQINKSGTLNIDPSGLYAETINGNVNVDGTIYMGENGTGFYSALYLLGTLTFNAGSTYNVGVDLYYLNWGEIIAFNNITINDGVTLHVRTEGEPQPDGWNYSFPIIASTTQFTGNFTTITQEGVPENWSFQYSLTATQ